MTFRVIINLFFNTYLDLIASAMSDVGGGGQVKLNEVSKLVSSLQKHLSQGI
jgi:hypothetical protein